MPATDFSSPPEQLLSLLELNALNPASGQLTYTVASLAVTVGIALQLFRYRAQSDFYSDGDIVLGTNYWRIANYIRGYGGLAIWSLAALTQLLSVASIANDVNMVVWQYGVGYSGTLLEFVAFMFDYAAYDVAY